ncbi:DMT family transporter [Patulibacter defluvii]|uniref:DMT family transporter n=1 Tax=Patulibacter defluvii TaxID=3095358 RepID=UPI002A765C18|nr:SMR family transporter [Patulibacter sp. DM4]
MSGWSWLGLAALLEVAWSQSIKPTEGFTRPLPTLVCLLLFVAAVLPLSKAMQSLPVGTAYVVFTGVGGVGAVVLGIALSGDPLTALRVLGAALVVAGVVVLRVSGG